MHSRSPPGLPPPSSDGPGERKIAPCHSAASAPLPSSRELSVQKGLSCFERSPFRPRKFEMRPLWAAKNPFFADLRFEVTEIGNGGTSR